MTNYVQSEWIDSKNIFFPALLKKYSSYRCELGGAYPVGVSDWTSWDNVGTGRVFPLCVLVDGIVVQAVKRLLFHRTDTLHKSHLHKQTRCGKQGRVWICGGQRGPNCYKFSTMLCLFAVCTYITSDELLQTWCCVQKLGRSTNCKIWWFLHNAGLKSHEIYRPPVFTFTK